MGIPIKVVLRDCAAVAVILLCVASAAAQAGVLASYSSYKVCTVSARGTCADVRAQPCPASAQDERVAFLQWAVAMHRAAASEAQVAVHTVRPAAALLDGADSEGADARRLACRL